MINIFNGSKKQYSDAGCYFFNRRGYLNNVNLSFFWLLLSLNRLHPDHNHHFMCGGLP